MIALTLSEAEAEVLVSVVIYSLKGSRPLRTDLKAGHSLLDKCLKLATRLVNEPKTPYLENHDLLQEKQ